MTQYNALDLPALATQLRDQLILEQQDVVESFEYECATGNPKPTMDEVDFHLLYVGRVGNLVKSINAYLEGTPPA